MTQINADLTVESKKTFARDIQILTLDDKKKKEVIKQSVIAIKKEALIHKRQQKSPQGENWAPRKRLKFNKKGKSEKLLKKIMKRSGVKYYSANRGAFAYRNPVSERIASEHQYGLVPQQVDKKNDENLAEETRKVGGATVNQAQKLLEAGFNEPINKRKDWRKRKNSNGNMEMKHWAKMILRGKHRKPSSVAYIMENLSFEQAGTLLRLLWKEQGREKKKSPRPALPARPFLNEDDNHNQQIITKEMDKVINLK